MTALRMTIVCRNRREPERDPEEIFRHMARHGFEVARHPVGRFVPDVECELVASRDDGELTEREEEDVFGN
jgi:hypothetical protein